MSRKIETLSPEQFTLPLQKHLTAIETTLKEKQASLKHAPTGLIRIVKNNGRFQFYKRKTKKDVQGSYLPRSQDSLALQLIQSDYNIKVVDALQKEICLLKAFLANYKAKSTTRLFEKLSPARRELVTPLTLPDNQFTKKWLSTNYDKKPISEDAPQLFTENGEQVRSKSEVIIANSLKAAGVPYRYEFPLAINRSASTCTFHPDFYCLNLRSRKEFIWEHFGMMDDAEYAACAAEKLFLYQQNR